MTIKELRSKLDLIKKLGIGDAEKSHLEADKALLEYIDDPYTKEVFKSIEKWYA